MIKAPDRTLNSTSCVELSRVGRCDQGLSMLPVLVKLLSTHLINAIALPSSDEYKIIWLPTIVDLRKPHIFGSPSGTPGAIVTKLRDSVWDRPPSLCKISAKFVLQCRKKCVQTHRQTANLISPHYDAGYKKQRSASLVCFNAELTIQGAPTNDEVNTAMTDYS